MTRKKLSVVLLVALVVLILPSAAQALIPFRVSVGELTTFGFQRAGGSVNVVRPINSAEYGFSDGILNFNIADSGQTTIIITTTNLGSSSFVFSSDGAGGVTSTQVLVTPRADGSYFFDVEFGNWLVCDQVELPALLMGGTRDINLALMTGGFTIWTGGRLDINRLWIWEAAHGEVPGLVRQIIYPDGTSLANFYPLGGAGLDPYDVPWYTTDQATATLFYFRADWHLNQTMFDALAAGTYTIRYWMSNGLGQRSNVRTEYLVVQK